MNLAVLIGISKYKNFLNLSQCTNDVKVINEIINGSKKYNEVLMIDENTFSGSIYNKIDAFLNKYKSKEINEILFYFSGHGVSDLKDFYYCTTNTDVDKLNTTSITNNNIDSIVRSLKPKLFVKIIDACNSGTMYIKGANNDDIFSTSAASLKDCYFFSSSKDNQESFVLNQYSSFTYSILKIMKKLFIDQKESHLKYRDLFNELNDMFENNSKQKPYFTMQGGMSEIFINNNEEICKIIEKAIAKEEKKQTEESNEISTTFITEESAISFKNGIIDYLKGRFDEKIELLEKYNYNIVVNNSIDKEIVSREKVCNWIAENKEKYFIFAKTITKRELKSNMVFKFFHEDSDYEYITNDYSVNVDKDNYRIAFDYISDRDGFPKFRCQLVFIYSLTKLYIIYTIGSSTPESWSEYSDFKALCNHSIKVINFSERTAKRNEVLKEIEKDYKSFINDYINNYIEAII